MTGQVFGRLTIEGRAPDDPSRKNARWYCLCECGTVVVVWGYVLRSGATQSCGCLQAERAAANTTTHGHTGTREHKAWSGAKSRCHTPTNSAYSDYGGRGIYMVQRWRDDFAMFLAEMGPCPVGHSIDRIDNDGPYSPENCRWAPRAIQNRNTRRNVFLEHAGDRLTVADWEQKLGFRPGTLKARVLSGWDAARALTTPVRRRAC